MHFLTIENLCLTAEAIVVLLLIAFPWGTSRKSQKSIDSNESAMDWELVKVAYSQACVFRGLYLQQIAGQPPQSSRDDLNGKSSFSYTDAQNRYAAGEIPEPWQDRLTKLINRLGFEQVLRAWIQVGEEYRSQSSVAMISLTGYSNLLSSHGAMVVEQALRAFADKLSESLGPDSLVARYQAERFIVLAYSKSSSDVHQQIETLQQDLSEASFFTSGEISFGLETIVSIADLGEECDAEQVVNQLDDGYLNADDRGCSIVSLQGGQWENQPAIGAKPSSKALEKKTDLQDSNAEESSALNENSKDNLVAEFPESTVVVKPKTDSDGPKAKSDEGNEEKKGEPATHDISAVANPADIEALFAEIRAKKEKATQEPSQASAPSVPSSISMAETASADDIAALFAANQPKKPSQASTQQHPKLEATATSSVQPPQPSLSETASADDIAALFAANAPKQAAKQEKLLEVKQEAKQKDAPTIDPTEAATADDIAALFATVKQAATPPNATDPAKPTSAPKPTEEELDTAASADDIAALFATVRPATAIQEKVVVESSNQTGEQLNEAATADDIAALFTSVQPKPPSQPTSANPLNTLVVPVANPSESVKPKIPTGEDLQNAASADDIAALFAVMKK